MLCGVAPASAARGQHGAPARAPKTGVLVLTSLLAAAVLTVPSSFVAPLGARAARSTPAPRTAFQNWASLETAGTEGPGIIVNAPLGALAFLAAVLLAFGSPQQASAGLLSELGTVDYDEEANTLKKSASYVKRQQAQVLEDAAAKAKQTSARKAAEAFQRERAAAALKKLDETRKAEEAQKEAKEKKAQEQRALIKESLDKKSAASSENSDSAKADKLFQQFLAEKAAKEAAQKTAFQKEEATRTAVINDLEKRKSDAQKAADEAESIAQRIEEMAKNAREAAALAKRSAELLKMTSQ